jgi:Tfp pilus assembly protein PilF
VQVSGLRVIARSPAAAAATDEWEVARRLGVGAVLAGTIQREHGEYRVLARLVGARRGEVLWSAELRRDTSEVLALETAITRALAELYGDTAVGAGPQPGGSADPIAHSLFLQGLYLANLRRAADQLRALEYFARAVEADPSFGLAHAYAARSYLLLGNFGTVPALEALERAESEAARALDIDDRIPTAHAATAQVRQELRDLDGAERSYRRALALNSGDAHARSLYGLLLIYRGRTDAGLRQLEAAQRLDPTSLGVLANLGWGYYFGRRYGQAIAAFDAVLRLDTAMYAMHNGSGRAYQQLGQGDEAIAAYRRAVAQGGTVQGRAFLAQGLASFGRTAEALALRDTLTDPSAEAYAMAVLYTGVGDLDAAFAALDRAVRGMDPRVQQVVVEPVFDALRSDPRYLALMRSLAVPAVPPRPANAGRRGSSAGLP